MKDTANQVPEDEYNVANDQQSNLSETDQRKTGIRSMQIPQL